MKLDILIALNTERAARRAAVVITNVENGKQRFVRAAEVGKDPLRAALTEHLRTGKSGMAETAEGRVFLTVYVPALQLVITGADRQAARLRRYHRRSTHGFCICGALSGSQGHCRMAG
jgi:xanthine dehydrogenase accessory factor